MNRTGRFCLGLVSALGGMWGDSEVPWIHHHALVGLALLTVGIIVRFTIGYCLIYRLVPVMETKTPWLAGVTAVIIGIVLALSGPIIAWLAGAY